MINSGILKTSAFHSVIGESSVLGPTQERRHRNILADLLLTALIDAFSILVIFLLMSFSSTGDLLFMGKNMELPKANKGSILLRAPVVKLDQGKMYLEDKEVTGDTLTAALLQLREQFKASRPNEEFPAEITVQADRRVKYEELNPIVASASQAGISDIKFAVIMR